MARKKASDNGEQATADPVVMVGFKTRASIKQRAENAAWHCRLTLTQILEAGLLHVVELLENKHNKGKPFAAAKGGKEIPL